MDRLYDPHKQTILVLGEASFSFAAALATTPIATSHGIHGLVASTLHPSVQHAEGMFPGAASNAALLSSRRGAKVICGVDATRLHFWPRGLGLAQAAGGFDVIVFPFPHTGYVPENVYENNWAHIARNKQLVADFFESAVHQLKPGILAEIHVLHMDVTPYSHWEIETTAAGAGLKLKAKDSISSFKQEYNGYYLVTGARRRCPAGSGVVRLPHHPIPFKRLSSIRHFRFVRASTEAAGAAGDDDDYNSYSDDSYY